MRSITSLLMRISRKSPRLRDPAHTHIDLRNLIPGRIIHDPGLGKIEDTLENPDCLGGAGAVDAVRRDPGDGWVVLGDTV